MTRSMLLLLAAACLPATAGAHTVQAGLSVSAVVPDMCRVNAAPRQLRVNCPGSTPYSVALDGGTGAPRLAGSSGGSADYELRDATTITLTY